MAIIFVRDAPEQTSGSRNKEGTPKDSRCTLGCFPVAFGLFTGQLWCTSCCRRSCSVQRVGWDGPYLSSATASTGRFPVFGFRFGLDFGGHLEISGHERGRELCEEEVGSQPKSWSSLVGHGQHLLDFSSRTDSDLESHPREARSLSRNRDPVLIYTVEGLREA